MKNLICEKLKRNKFLILLLIIVMVRFLNVCTFGAGHCGAKENIRFESYKEYEKEGLDKDRAKVGDTSLSDYFNFIDRFRNNSIQKARNFYPSPHSELLLGIVLGIDELQTIPTFNDILIATGTIHVVVVSGYNINLLFSFLKSFLGGIYSFKKYLIAVIATLVYSVISGFEPPVIRAWIMSSVSGLGMFYGRKMDPVMLLLFSGLVMTFFDPGLLYSLSFQLSFLASLSLLMFSPIVKAFFATMSKQSMTKSSQNLLQEDLVSSFSAQILVWPVISINFGRVSIFSPFINSIILWTIPVSTILGAAFLFSAFINYYLAFAVSLFLYTSLDIFVQVLRLFSNIPFLSVTFKLNALYLIVYYLAVFVLYQLFKKKLESAVNLERKYAQA